MKIGLVSDTHDQVDRTARALSLLDRRGARLFLHAGDITTPEVVACFNGLESHFVLGNNDRDAEPLQQAIAAINGHCCGYGEVLNLSGRRIALTHGHLKRETARLLAKGPDYLVQGHPHRVLDIRIGPTRSLNPGALHRASFFSVGLLDPDVDTFEVIIVDR